MTLTETKKQANPYREGGHRLQAAPEKRFAEPLPSRRAEIKYALPAAPVTARFELKIKVEPCLPAPLAFYALWVLLSF